MNVAQIVLIGGSFSIHVSTSSFVFDLVRYLFTVLFRKSDTVWVLYGNLLFVTKGKTDVLNKMKRDRDK